jgi:glycosyltransferase involved in cell wall biosynthesis
MNNNIRFGIYTTFYNCERFIERIFTSIEMLNYDEFEWHITDDYSTDNTKSLVLERLNKSPLKHKISYYEQSEKKQMYWKPNKFFDTTFDWIILVDADDDFDKNFLNVYNKFLYEKSDVSLVSSDFFKINENDNSRHSISYIINNDIMSNKINQYHPSCDYLNNISYSCFGHLRGFKNIIPSIDVDDMLACAEDSYHIFWSNSFGKYLHIPRPLYTWYLREDSESHRKVVPSNFNNNFKIALNKLKQSDGGIDKTFNDIYIETSTLGSYDSEKLKNKKVSLWTRKLSEGQKNTLQTLYYDVELSFNEIESEIHIFTLNYFNDDDLEEILQKLKGKQMMFYYQNQKYHSDNNKKDKELENQLNYYKKIIGKYTNYSWWTYIRHFIINN